MNVTRSARCFALGLCAAVICLAFGTSSHAQRRANKSARIMIVSDGSSDSVDVLIEHFQKECTELLRGDTKVEFLRPNATGDWTMKSVSASVREAVSTRGVDVIVGFGPMVGVIVGRLDKLKTPVVLPYAAPALQGLPRDGNASGKRNLAYITGLLNFERELSTLKELVEFDSIAFIIGPEIVMHLKDSRVPAREAGEKLGVEARAVVAKQNAEQTIAAIPEHIQGVYLGSLLQWTTEETQKLIDGLNDRGLPVYAGEGVQWVERGALATTRTREDETRRLRRAALYVERALSGEDPATFAVDFDPRPELVINMATVRKIGVWPKFDVLAEARTINDTSGTSGPEFTLESVMRDSLNANLDLSAESSSVRASKAAVGEARSNFLPQVGASAGYTIIDSDVASPFAKAERTLDWGISGSQTLYSPAAQGGLAAQKQKYKGDLAGYQATRLDTMLDAANAFLNVLRAKTSERVNKENLTLARKNLALAETRNKIGVAGREEVYRWEIEIAGSRSDVIRANATRNQAEIELNRVLNRPLEASFQTPDASPESPLEMYDPELSKYVSDPWSFRVFRSFMVAEAIEQAPELRQVNAGLKAQDRLIRTEKQGLATPDIALNGGFTHILNVDGVGSGPLDPSLGFPSRDKFSWQVGIAASLDIFEGGRRVAKLQRLTRERNRLSAQKESIAQRVEQRVRSALHSAGASSASIDLRRSAAESATRNLDLVTDAYQRGAVDIITLIDAQNQALLSNLAAANALYDFLLDLMEVERAAGGFRLEQTPDERKDFYQRLASFAAQQRIYEKKQQAIDTKAETK